MASSRKAHPNGDEGYGVSSPKRQPYSKSYRRGSIQELMRRLRLMAVTATDDGLLPGPHQSAQLHGSPCVTSRVSDPSTAAASLEEHNGANHKSESRSGKRLRVRRRWQHNSRGGGRQWKEAIWLPHARLTRTAKKAMASVLPKDSRIRRAIDEGRYTSS
ncbi:hypothetical protein V6N12_046081 [Hibiscus sabdariffa]|uniref:Uncharacterized protein n=1 Tax=Hibiscus sabdariffa TaxID=183260 RepID=A0ABR2G5C5_9ROSI